MTGKVQVRLAVLIAVTALVAVLVPVGAAFGNEVLDGIEFLDCGDELASTEDSAAESALVSDGYSCTGLFNKPTIDSSSPQRVGQLWFKLDGTILQMRVLFFGGANTGFGDSKICLDDDGNPINNVAPGGASAPTCVGHEFQWTLNQGGNNGPSYSPSRFPDAREEPAGKLEVAVEKLTEVSEVFNGITVGGWNVNLGPNPSNMFTEILPHFNLGGFSIVGYFQPTGQRILCGETIILEDGDLTASFTLEGIEGVANDSPDCFKEIDTAIDGDAGTVLFEPSGDGAALYTGTITAENDVIDLDPDEPGFDSVILEYDPTGPDFFDSFQLVKPATLTTDGSGTVLDCVLADGETWGYTDVNATPTGGDFTDGPVLGTESWEVCGKGDPGFSVR